MNSSKRKGSCSLCGLKGHQARGIRCPLVHKYKAVLVESADAPELATGMGNPMLYEVKKPDDDTKMRIKEWFQKKSDEIPEKAWHMVLMNCFFCGLDNTQFEYNILEVTLLEEGGTELSGYEIAYFPVYRIQPWLKENGCKRKRKRHVMSKLRRQTTKSFYEEICCYNV